MFAMIIVEDFLFFCFIYLFAHVKYTHNTQIDDEKISICFLFHIE